METKEPHSTSSGHILRNKEGPSNFTFLLGILSSSKVLRLVNIHPISQTIPQFIFIFFPSLPRISLLSLLVLYLDPYYVGIISALLRTIGPQTLQPQ